MFLAAFYKGTHSGFSGLFNRFTRFWTKGPYSHMELVFSDGMSASSSFIDGGVRTKLIDHDLEKWDLLALPSELEADAIWWFARNSGKAYDYWADIRFGLGFAPESADKYMCAEACMAALGFTDSWRIEPNAAYAILKRFTT